MDKLRVYVAHFSPRWVVRSVKLFGFVKDMDQAGIDARQLIQSRQCNESDTIPVIVGRGGQAWDGESNEDVTVSVVIPVKDAGDDFRLLLSSLTRQKGFKNLEIVVVDSGSSDLSVEMAHEFGAKVLQIAPEEFSHSYARNLAAENSSGDYLLFMVQDALPSSDLWLHELFSVLQNNDVVAVSCAESPKDDADLFYRASCWNHYKFLEVDKRDRILSKPETSNYFTLRKNAPLSNLACLMPRNVFAAYKFRGKFAEDLELGLRLIRDGHKLAMLSTTKVIHSHNRPAYYHLKRGYVDVLLLCDIFPDVPIAAIDPDRLLQDVLYTRGVVDSLVKRLTRIEVGSPVDHISRIVVDHYRSFSAEGRSVTAGHTNGYVDKGFGLFLDNVWKRYGSQDLHDLKYDGILLDAMQGATKTVLNYMANFHEIVDEKLLEEFRGSLYKVFASQCGSYLGACYARGSERMKRELETLNKELTQGI
jgi:GT2 family glycosyltransferase